MLSVPSRQVKLTWQERIYDAAFTNGSQSSTSRRDGVELCGDRFVSHVPPFQWQKLLAAVREENLEKQLATVLAVQVSWCCCSHVPQLCTLFVCAILCICASIPHCARSCSRALGFCTYIYSTICFLFDTNNNSDNSSCIVLCPSET